MTSDELLAQTMAQLDNISAGIRQHLSLAPKPPVEKPPVEVPPGEPHPIGHIDRFEGPVPGHGLWRVELTDANDFAHQPVTIPAQWPNATLYCGDPGFAFMQVEVEGMGVISNGTPQCAFPGAAGTYQVKVTCSQGCGPVGIYIRETP